MLKPGKKDVRAVKVLDIVPCFEAMPHRVLQVSNDEVQTLWEEKLTGMDAQAIQRNSKLSNGQLLVNQRTERDEKTFALCRLDFKAALTKSLRKQLGVGESEALLFETVRNYGFSQKTVDAKNEFVAKFENDQLVYMPVNNQIGLQKLKHLSR